MSSFVLCLLACQHHPQTVKNNSRTSAAFALCFYLVVVLLADNLIHIAIRASNLFQTRDFFCNSIRFSCRSLAFVSLLLFAIVFDVLKI
jgi:hypothetical protein